MCEIIKDANENFYSVHTLILFNYTDKGCMTGEKLVVVAPSLTSKTPLDPPLVVLFALIKEKLHFYLHSKSMVQNSSTHHCNYEITDLAVPFLLQSLQFNSTVTKISR